MYNLKLLFEMDDNNKEINVWVLIQKYKRINDNDRF